MKYAHFQEFFERDYELESHRVEGDDVIEGALIPRSKRRGSASILRGIPRFVQGETYADNFGLQWNTFRSTQLDSASGVPLTANRFWNHTKWTPQELRGKTILEIGSGAGRFTEIMLLTEARVVSIDYSSAVEANLQNNRSKGDLLVLQADLYELPFDDDSFDYVFCHGVLQHTPDPEKAYQAIFAKVRPGGKISIDYYLKTDRATPWTTPKYFWRRYTATMPPQKLLKIIETYIPLWLPFDTALRRIPRVGQTLVAHARIPCWNYIGLGLTYRQRREWAIMDTFDALGARYDWPKTLEEVRTMTNSSRNAVLDVFYGGNGVVANATKRI